jgi:Equine arteritis virus serine endopeptidase S32
MFYPQSTGRTTFKFPTNRQLRINGCVTRELLAVPDCFNSKGEPCLIVMKDGNATDLTVGRYAGLEAYLCDDLGVESTELAIYNYDKQSGSFSAKGDSGSLIFDGEGHMVGILHSGIPKGGSNHITYATPAWWAIQQLKLKYPHADFNRIAF